MSCVPGKAESPAESASDLTQGSQGISRRARRARGENAGRPGVLCGPGDLCARILGDLRASCSAHPAASYVIGFETGSSVFGTAPLPDGSERRDCDTD
jgi:hypothetical protein